MCLDKKTVHSALLITFFLIVSLVTVSYSAENAEKPKRPCSSDKPWPTYFDPEESHREWNRDYLQDVHFANPLRGWATGGDGSVFSTEDGGRTWSSQKVATPDIGFLRTKIGFRTPQEGWLIAEEQFFKTTDGGTTWQRAAMPVACTYRIYYATPKTGWLFSLPNRIFKTTDGGRTWRQQSIGSAEVPAHIACFSERQCIVVGTRGLVLTTSDGSKWSASKAPVGRMDLREVKVTRDATAWITAGERYDGYLFRSGDKGRNWMQVGKKLPDVPISSIFWSSKKGVIAGYGIYWTGDGGLSWAKGSIPDHENTLIRGIYFVNQNLGWAVGQFRTILHTKNGGVDWIEQHRE